ncbi:MAG: GWxTD domain-containing protein [Ignavibacteriaceae bacterium]
MIRLIIVIISIIMFSVTYAQNSYNPVNSFHQQGLIALHENRMDEAEELFKYSSNEFSYAPSFYELAKIEYSRNTLHSRTKARKYIQKAVWKDPKNIEYRLLQAKLMSFFSSKMAYDVYEEIVAINPNCVEALYNMGIIKEEEFYEFYKSIRQEQFEPSVSFDFFAFEDFMKAERLLLKVINHDPEKIEAYLHLSYLYEEVGEFERAIPFLREVIKIDSTNKDAYLYLGYLCYKTGRHDSSLVSYTKALQLMNEKEEENFNVNSAHLFVGMDEENQVKYKLLIDKFWNSSDPLYLTDYNERLLEHYSRVAFSNLRFSVEDQDLLGWQTDRGETVIRYGEPLNRIRFRPYINAGGKTALMLKTDVWFYPDKVFGFTDDYWTGNYRFSSPKWGGATFSQFLYDTHSYAQDLRRINPEDYVPKFKGPTFNVPFHLVQFKDLDDDSNNNTQLYVNYAMDVTGKFEFNNKYKLEHKCGLFILDQESNKQAEQVEEVTYLNTDRELKINDYEKYWINSIQVESKPDTEIIAFEIIRNEDEAVSTNHFEYSIKKFSNDELDMSDILLATDVGNSVSNKGAISRRDLKILPNPTQIFTNANNIFIYYEAYNLKLDGNNKADFEQRITIKNAKESSVVDDIFASISNIFGSGNTDDKITLTTNYQSFEKNAQVYLQIDMNAYIPGDYIVSVTVEDKVTGEEASSETILRWR